MKQMDEWLNECRNGEQRQRAQSIFRRKRCRTPEIWLCYRNQSRQTIELKSKLYTRARETLLQLATTWQQRNRKFVFEPFNNYLCML